MRIYILGLLLLSACATPVTAMRNGDSVVTCGGSSAYSMIGGFAGYQIQRSQDKDCVNQYAAQGYVIARP